MTGLAVAETLADAWGGMWPRALKAWSEYTQLRPPCFYETDGEAAADGMAGEIAAIRLRDQKVMVNLAMVRKRSLEDCGLAIMAHEIGHHVYVPGNLTDNARMLAAIGRMLSGLPSEAAHLTANLFGDLLINDRLQRRAGVDIAAVYLTLALTMTDRAPSAVWKVYTRTYEHLWRLPARTLAPDEIDAETDADAMLLARMVRNFAGDWLRGARRFAAVMYPYLAQDQAAKREQTFNSLGLNDTKQAGAAAPGQSEGDAIPDGLAAVDSSELEDDDSFDGDIVDPLGERKESLPTPSNSQPKAEGKGQPGRQFRAPFEYGQILRTLGLSLKDHEITTRYYRERALPHLIPFPTRRAPRSTEPLPEGYEDWSPSDPLDAFDAMGSIIRSPVVVPGVTTVRRVYGETPGAEPARIPMDLDIYVDSSGSMPNPAVDVSYLALAGAILAMSALRAGARVQATVWSGPRQFDTTGGFIRDENRVLGIVTGFIAGSTAFPLSVLRETYEKRKPSDPAAHIVVISDDGADTMLEPDEKRRPGGEICSEALSRAGGGGSLVLNLPGFAWGAEQTMAKIGFTVHRVQRWEELVAFAQAFVRENYGEKR